ncbi:MAG: putative ferredoxin reductase [Friedmanniella sp.]|nr:putative ferredoxin reductase [Friedmanniella sp.]
MTSGTMLIVGAGLTGAIAAETLREQGFGGPITLVGAETHHPYERPPLSKAYLQGQADRESLFVHPDHWYADHQVELRLGTRATALHLDSHTVTTAEGTRLRYDRLLLATGSTPRRLAIPGADLDRIRYLRRLEDSDQIRADLQAARRVVVVGAGWIGLETAAAARSAGLAVTVLEAADLPLVRVLGPEPAQLFADLHRRHGVDLRCGVQVTGFTGQGGVVTGVQLRDGDLVPADLVLVGVGITPNVELAREAGLELTNGISVDEHLRTSDPDVYAAGDVADTWHPELGERLRVEHWANASRQGAVAARSMLGQQATDTQPPYFFTDQYDLSMEYTGYVGPGSYDQVVFRHLTAEQTIVFWLRERRVLAGMNVNVWDVADQISRLVRSRSQVDTAHLADPGRPLSELGEPAGSSSSP